CRPGVLLPVQPTRRPYPTSAPLHRACREHLETDRPWVFSIANTHARASNSFGLSGTSRSREPLPCRIWTTMRLLSMSVTFNSERSDVLLSHTAHQYRAIHEVRCPINHATDFLGTQNGRQFPRRLGNRQIIKVHVAAFE